MFFFAFLWACIWTALYATTPVASAMDTRLAFLLPHLANALVRIDDVAYVVTDNADALEQGVAFVKVRKIVDEPDGLDVDASALQKQVRPMAALKAYMCAMDLPQVVGQPFKVSPRQKTVVMEVIERHASWNERKKSTRQLAKNMKATHSREVAKLRDYDSQLAARGEQYGGDGTYRSTIVHKVDQAAEKLAALNQTQDELGEEETSVFVNLSDIVTYFKDTFDMDLSPRTLNFWRNSQCLRPPGRPAAYSPEAEEELIKTILYLDSCAFPMGPTEIRALAGQMTADPKIQARFSDQGPSKSWFKSFMKRNKEKHPELVVVSKRSTNCNTTKWFNSELVLWWFAKFAEIVVKEGFAFYKDDQLEWTDAGRVLFTDETCVSGGGVRKASNGREACVSDEKNCSVSDLGKLSRLVGSKKEFEDHMTLIGGLTVRGEPTPPGWVVTCTGIPTPKTIKRLIQG
jgi:hypothetical protein